MFMEILLIMIFLFYLIFKLNIYFMSLIIFIYSILMITKLSCLKWWMISFSFGLNNYSYGLIILILWIMGVIIMNLIEEKLLLNCLILLNIMFMFLIFNFLSMNLILFYLFFEINLLLMFYLIMNWSYGIFKILAAYLLFFYTLLFSIPMFVIMMFMKVNIGSLSFLIMELSNFSLMNLMFYFLIMGFLVKIPMYLLHFWLFKAHVEAPYFGSMILASIMLKLGGYGLIRMSLIFLKEFFMKSYLFMSINILGMLLLSLMCLRQIDMKVLIAISSVIHMGLMISGIFTLSKMGFLGSYFMMLSHGLSSAGMFYLVNVIYKQTKSRLMFLNKGMIMFMPSMSLMWFMLLSTNMASPISFNLVSEIFLLISLMMWIKFLMLFLMMYCLFSFIYSIYLFSYIQHGFMESLNYFFYNGKIIMFLTLLFHWVPLNIMIFNMNFMI